MKINRKKPFKIGQKILTKNLSFLKDFHSLTPAARLGILLNKSRSQALYSQCLTARPRG